MRDSVHEFDQVRDAELDGRPVRVGDIVRSIAAGIAALIVIALIGGCLVGLIATQFFPELRGVLVVVIFRASTFVLLLVGPLSVGPAVALVIGLPAMTMLAGRKRRPILLGVVGVAALVVATVFWWIGTQLALLASLRVVQWSSGERPKVIDHYLALFWNGDTVVWSHLQAIILAVTVLVALPLVERRFRGRWTRIRRVAATTGALMALSGIVFAVHATLEYQSVLERLHG
ncbi:hypothetical protein [Nocardia sp. NPDC052566]|uniref:hypothetical protein n=1 Tax=Nocardia sp. NPDC052566 TaxID=3364330 RepID=UPI0037C7E130